MRSAPAPGRRERPLLPAAIGYAVAAAHGSRVALREDVVGEPFGLRPPGPVAAHLAAGFGSGVSPPWPMPVAALALGVRARPGAGAAAACAVLGAAFVCGQLVEPVAWGRRPAPPAVTRAVALNLAAGAALALAGLRGARAAR